MGGHVLGTLGFVSSSGWRPCIEAKFESTRLFHFKCKFKTECYFEILVAYLVNISKIIIKQRGTLRIRVYFSLENNKKIYEFFIELQAGFYKSDWYGYNFVDLVELILKISVLLHWHFVRKISWLLSLPLFSVFTKF